MEIPLSDPFGSVYRDEVDAALVLLPMGEADLVLGQVFSENPQTLAVASDHPFAQHDSLDVEDLGQFPLIGVRGPAPQYWQRAQALEVTPSGRAVAAGPMVATLAEGLAQVAAGRGAMLLCASTAADHRRGSVTFVPITGLAASRLGLVWHRNRETARIRAFSQAIAAALADGTVE